MKRPVAKISNHSRRLATFASDVIEHSRRLAKVANLRFALLRVQSKRTFTANCDDDDSDKHFVKVSYVGAASNKRFTKQLSEPVKCKFGVEIYAISATYKVGRYFQLKSATPITLSSNVVY